MKSENYLLLCVCAQSSSHVQLFAAPWTVAHQTPLTMEFSRQEYWSGLSFPSPRDLPNPGIEPESPALQADALPSELPGKPVKSVSTLLHNLWLSFAFYMQSTS